MDAIDCSSVVHLKQGDGSSGTYMLRSLVSDTFLSTSGHEQAYVTCADVWNGNLYVGTSAGEILHYVSIPHPTENEQPIYIFATKLELPHASKIGGQETGVKQILLLPEAGKVCVLCHGTLTFYTMPELSPAYPEHIKQVGCTWVGGLDASLGTEEHGSTGGPVVVICLKQRLRLVRIGKEAQRLRNIELGDVTSIQRHGDLACVADNTMYSLLDLVNDRKNNLFPIFSSAGSGLDEESLQETPQRTAREPSRSLSTLSAGPIRQAHGHNRNVSLGSVPKGGRLQPGSPGPLTSGLPARPSILSERTTSRETSPAKSDSASRRTSTEVSTPKDLAVAQRLPPNIVSATPTEFLLTTGTSFDEPGIGMFVNLEGDPSRAPLDFCGYPESLVLEGDLITGTTGTVTASDSESYALALVRKSNGDKVQRAIEIQRWDVDPGVQNAKEFLTLDAIENERANSHGLRLATGETEVPVPEITELLGLRRLTVQTKVHSDVNRDEEEDKLASRLSRVRARTLLFTDRKIQWILKRPLLMRLNQQLDLSVDVIRRGGSQSCIDTAAVEEVMKSIHGQDARSELEYRTLDYVRQKASVIVFGNLLLQSAGDVASYERNERFAEEALNVSQLDPRVVLSMTPPLQMEIHEGEPGIWIPHGLRNTINMFLNSFEQRPIFQDVLNVVQETHSVHGGRLMALIKRYFLTWRLKKGFGSVADEVSKSVDAALLHILLLLDKHSPRGPATAGSIRAELNEIVDRGVDCFDRAIQLFTQFDRLYMLSRLYQSRKMSAQVLATWKRILEGEQDLGGELIDGEHDVRRYLSKLRDRSLVQEYGAWLANRRPSLGVLVFADSGKVTFEPAEVVEILKANAANAVKHYFEYLAFSKQNMRYVNDLITIYIDGIIDMLQKPEVRNALLASYESYRAGPLPKSTYREFITSNAANVELDQDRLHLLQLIGGGHMGTSNLKAQTLKERLQPYRSELLPEMIVISSLEGNHKAALKLLIHGLRDYDTAVRYCLFGGRGIFNSRPAFEQSAVPKQQQAQLFTVLLGEYLDIDDLRERVERTAELLERFSESFDVGSVLDLIPDSWSVEIVSGFLVFALRRLIQQRNESSVTKSLASAQNLKLSVDFLEKADSIGPTIAYAGVEIG